MATYTIRTAETQNWRDTMMSKAEFNAVAAERRANRAGSGFDEFGLGTTDAGTSLINEGMYVYSSVANTIKIGRGIAGTLKVGTSKTYYPLASINGIPLYLTFLGIGANYTDVSFLLPTAPTVLPYDAVLTQQQIDSGVIKHADASNSGLIVNGKFDTNTSGWITGGGGYTATLTVDTNRLKITNTTIYGNAYQSFTTVVGKKYTAECFSTLGTATRNVIGAGATATQAITGALGINISTVGGYQSIEFVATSTTTYIAVGIDAGASTTVFVDNIAVFPADAISRSELVFLESWHEDVSEKDFVYPLGNVQYLGTTGDAGTTVAGAFAGSATYSLFSDTWQADGALVGKGYVWSTLSDANKKAFVANPENNCYLDGDKVIQVRYRMRVVMGEDTNSMSKATVKGKEVAESTTLYTTPASTDYGLYYNTSSTYSHATSGAIPIALVHRRNQGGYNATYNPNGTKTMTMTPANISDCFNPANYTAATGYIGTSTSRPDGLFYDQVSVEDFKPANKGADLRNSSKKRTASSIIEEFAPKVIAGTLLYNTNDTTALTTYKDTMEVRDTSGNRYPMKNKIGNVVTIQQAVSNKKGFSVVTQNGKQWLQVADDATNDDTVQMNASVIKYDIGVFDAV